MAKWTVALALLVALVQVANSAVIIGIDFGTNFIKVAYVQPGKMFDIVLNENSKRKTENVLGFDRGHRLYGTDGLNLAVRSPKYVFQRSRDFLGANLEAPELQHLKDMHIHFDAVHDEETGGIKLLLDNGKKEQVSYYPEEVVGMILAYIKRISSTYIGTDVTDCVITVPNYFTQVKREALLNAAEIAGLNVLTLVDENVAAAVQHGIYNEFTNSSHKVLVYNMGSASTKVTLFDFYGIPGADKKFTTQIDVLAKAWDRSLGGDSFDMTMFDMFVEAFDKHHMSVVGDTVRASKRAIERIRAQANKVKTVLSANMEIPVSIESLFGGKDLKMHVTRESFEQESKSLFERVVAPIEAVLQKSGTTVEDLFAVELIGGGVRVPRVKDILTEYFKGKELGNHLNGDEAKAFGSVFIGANMSKAFRVRRLGIQDITVQPVSVEMAELDPVVESGKEVWRKSTSLFNYSAPLNTQKTVSFSREKDVICTLFRMADSAEDEPVAEYEIKGVAAAIEKYGAHGKPKISLSFHLTHNDTVVLSRAEAQFTEEIPAPPEETSQEETTSTTTAESDATSETTETSGEADQSTEQTDDTTASSEGEKKESEAEEASENKTEKKKEKKKSKKPTGPTKKIHRFPLSISRTDSVLSVKPISAEAKQKGRETLLSFEAAEESKRMHEAAKNELEAFIFESRDKLRSNEEDVDKVITEEQKDQLFEDLTGLEDWLDDDGDSAEMAEFKKKRSEMTKRISKIFYRMEELDQRPATIRASKKFIETTRKQINDVWPKERPWIAEEERVVALEVVAQFETWLLAAEKEQAGVSTQDDAVLSSSMIVGHLEPVQEMLEQAFKRPLPRPPKQPKKKDGEKKESTKKEETEKPSEEEGKEKEKEKDEL